MVINILNKLSRNSRNHRMRGNVMSNNCPSSNDSSFSYMNPFNYHRIGANHYIVINADWFS